MSEQLYLGGALDLKQVAAKALATGGPERLPASMIGWLGSNRDYLFFALACVALFALLEAWLRTRRPRSRLSPLAWPVLLTLLGGGWFFVEEGGHSESRRIQNFLQGVAPTYAEEISRLGHQKLTLTTSAEDPAYLEMIAATKRWKAVNPAVSDIYTFRRAGDKVVLMVSSETDYNHDGQFTGEREQRVPLGTEYPEADAKMLRALDGHHTFSEEPVRDAWGVWVSAQVPLRDSAGHIEGALGVDYPAEKWLEAIAAGRQRRMWLLAIPVLMLGFATATTGALRAEIGARRGVEKQLRESEARLLTAIDSIPFDFWVMDANHRYVLSNAASRSHWGESIGKKPGELGLPADTEALWKKNNDRAFAGEIVRGEVTIEVGGQRRRFYNIIAPVRVGDKILGILGLNIDLTERLEAEEALRKSERRFARHVRQTPLAVIEWDLDFRVTAWNPAAVRIFGYATHEVMGQLAADLIVPPAWRATIAQVWKDILAQKGGQRSTNENITKDGHIILCEWYNTPLIDENGVVVGVASHCQDITQRAAMEKQLRQTQKIESLGQLAAGVAHEFNNLLTPMLLRLEMLRTDHAKDTELLASLRSIEDAIDQAAQLNQRILAVGRRAGDKRELLALNPVVDDTLALLRHTFDRRIVLDVRLGTGLGPLLLDRSQVAQIVVNLALNARDALLEKLNHTAGTAWTPRIEASTSAVEAAQGGDGVSNAPFTRHCQRLTISDNGAGMTDEVRAHVFEPFYTTKSPGQGTGLGLAVVWNVVKNLDGWIEIQSQPGEGTTFHIYFPIPETPLVSAGRGGAGANASGGGAAGNGTTTTGTNAFNPDGSVSANNGATDASDASALEASKQKVLRVLLIEDNVFVADTITRLLNRYGHTVTYAQNGEEAWTLCLENLKGFDLVMTDQNMPVLTGIEFVRRLRKSGSAVPVVVVSGHLAPDLVTEFEALGVRALLGKPFTQKELLDAISVV